MNVFYVENINGLAEVNSLSGNIYLNKKIKKLPSITQKFILEHEKAHFLLNTSDEFKADTYALNKIYGTEYQSLKKIIDSVLNTLPFDRKEHYDRLNNLIVEIAKIDYFKNKNKNALNLISMINIYDFPETQVLPEYNLPETQVLLEYDLPEYNLPETQVLPKYDSEEIQVLPKYDLGQIKVLPEYDLGEIKVLPEDDLPETQVQPEFEISEPVPKKKTNEITNKQIILIVLALFFAYLIFK